MATEDDDLSGTDRLMALVTYAISQHIELQPVVEDRSTKEATATVRGHVQFHEIIDDFLKAVLLVAAGCAEKAGHQQAKLLAIRGIRSALEDAIADMPPASEIGPAGAWFCEQATLAAAQFLTDTAGPALSVQTRARVTVSDEINAQVARDAAMGGEG